MEEQVTTDPTVISDDFVAKVMRGPKPKYPWDQWLDGRKRRLFPEKHFQYSSRNFCNELRKQARKRGLKCSCVVTIYTYLKHHPEQLKPLDNKECVIIQATGQRAEDLRRHRIRIKDRIKPRKSRRRKPTQPNNQPKF